VEISAVSIEQNENATQGRVNFLHAAFFLKALLSQPSDLSVSRSMRTILMPDWAEFDCMQTALIWEGRKYSAGKIE
jgi:hypothetical protein